MAKQLSTEQVLLLNNLMYMPKKESLKQVTEAEGKTVKEWISNIEVSQLQTDKDYGSYITGDDWKNIITTIKQDEQLLNMKIVNTHIDRDKNGGGGASAVFVDSSTNEAVVAFRGTANQEWKDNFTGGGKTDAADGVSTFQQENALKWYESLDLEKYGTVTVTGHSKGGNKAKYITVMDDSVDRCLSFDGQGFSDDFFDKYNDKISANQDKITNHIVESDYVNLLLNDIGDATFYKGYDYGKGSFLENHCPNTFLDFKSDGTVQMTVGKRDEKMADMDEFLNNYLRTLSPEDKQKTLLMIGNLVEKGFNGADANQILDVLLKDDNVDYAANLAAYLLKYKEKNPQLVNNIKDILNEMGMENVTKIVDTVDDITNSKYFDTLMDGAGWLSEHISDSVYEQLISYLKEKGIDLSKEELKKLLGMIRTMADDMNDIDVADNGADMVVPHTSNEAQANSKGAWTFSIYPGRLDSVVSRFDINDVQLMAYADVLHITSNILGDEYYDIKQALKLVEKSLLQEATQFKEMGAALKEISHYYQTSEEIINVRYAAMSMKWKLQTLL